MIPIKDNIPSRTFPIVNITLIAINSVVFIYEVSLGSRINDFVMQYGLTPIRFLFHMKNSPLMIHESVLPVFSSMFLHYGWFHIIGNMIFLWIFGDNTEDRMGHLRYLVFYLLCGVSAAMAQVFVNPNSGIPMIGASGAIAGVVGAYLMLYPGARILTLVPIFFFAQFIEVPALVFIGFWFILQFVNGTLSLCCGSITGGVAWWAHIGGFVAGMVLVRLFRRREISEPPSGYWTYPV